MRNRFFFLVFGFVILFNSLVLADGLLEDGEPCLNDFECASDSCVEQRCGSVYSPIFENEVSSSFDSDSLLSKLLGIECEPESSEEGIGWKCEGEYLYTCGADGVFEGDTTTPSSLCGYDGGGDNGDDNNGGGGGGSSSFMGITVVSPGDGVTYSSKIIPLEVYDYKKRAKYWRYSLNDGVKISFVPNTTINAKEGVNKLIVYSSKYSSYSSESQKTVNFNVVSSSADSYCGDGVCSVGESKDNCAEDCESDKPYNSCGNGECDYDEAENSDNCPEDCEVKEKTSYLWLFVLIVIFLLFLIGIVIFFIVKRFNKNIPSNESFTSSNSGKPSSSNGFGITASKVVPKKVIPQKISSAKLPDISSNSGVVSNSKSVKSSNNLKSSK